MCVCECGGWDEGYGSSRQRGWPEQLSGGLRPGVACSLDESSASLPSGSQSELGLEGLGEADGDRLCTLLWWASLLQPRSELCSVMRGRGRQEAEGGGEGGIQFCFQPSLQCSFPTTGGRMTLGNNIHSLGFKQPGEILR